VTSKYVDCVEPQRPLAPHAHFAILGTIPRDILRTVAAATYHQVWWPSVDVQRYTADRPPVWEEDASAWVDPTFDGKSWRPAVEAAGIVPTRATGMHALRHFYASALLDAGESIKALASYLGHSDPGFTLRVYTHLMPSSEEWTRHAIDDLLGR